MLSFLRNHWVVVLILILGVFLRTYAYSDFMHFELDQARDAFVSYDALSGAQWPQKGPMARGSDLFLGPAFYYFQIISGFVFHVLFGVTLIEAIAIPDLFFGVGSLLLVYIFTRRFFAKDVAVALLLLCVTSLYLITYDRFAWNPNSMVFWSLLFFVSFVRMFSSDAPYRYLASGLAAFSLGILVQLHFIAFVVLPIVVLPVSILYRQALTKRIIITFCGVLFVVLLPLLTYELRTGGETVRAFFHTVEQKQTKSHHTIVERVFRSVQETSTYFTATVFSDPRGRALVKSRFDAPERILCNAFCKKFIIYLVLSLFFLCVSLSLFFRQRIFLGNVLWTVSFLWFFGSFLFVTILAYQISPRFYLFFFPVFLLLWAILLQFLCTFFQRILPYALARAAFWIAVFLFVFLNLFFVCRDFQIAASSQRHVIDVPRDAHLGRSDRVTLGALRTVAHKISLDSDHDSLYRIVGDNRYARALYYILHVEYDDKRVECYSKRGGFDASFYAAENLWVLVRSRSRSHIPEALKDSHDIVDSFSVGTLMAYKLDVKDSSQIEGSHDVPKGCFRR